MSKVHASQPSVPPCLPTVERRLPIALMHLLEDCTVPSKLALVIRLSEAASGEDDGVGTSPALDALFWRGLEGLCREMLREVEELLQVSGVQVSGFAMLADEKGGVR